MTSSRSVQLSIAMIKTLSAAFSFALILWAGANPCHAQLPKDWSGIDIGKPTAGSDTFSQGVYTVTGAGTGIHREGDQMHFTSTTLTSGGNFRLTVRVASLTGAAGSEVGLTVRGGLSPAATMAAIAYEPAKGSGTNPNVFEMFARNNEPGAIYPWRNNACATTMAAPCWLQLVRFGNNFAVYKSMEGKFWSQVQSGTGSAFSVPGAIQVGFYVASGGAGTVTATIDHVKLERNPKLAYESSWIGNSFSSDYDGYVSGGASALWVAPDGTCYVTSFWDEGGEGGKSYKNGKVVHGFSLNTGHPFEGSIASDGTHLYYFGSIAAPFNQIYQTTLSGSQSEPYQPMYLQTPLLDPKTGANKMTGLAFGNGELYVSDQVTNQVLVVNPGQNLYSIGSNVVSRITDHVIDTSGVSNPAPQAVYQSSFQSDFNGMNIPGLTPGQSYNVRLHFAETNPDDGAVGKRFFNVNVGGQSKTNFDIFATTGALYKATTLSFNGVTPGGDGKIGIAISRASGSPDSWGTISGIEILKADGSPFLAINCGGPAEGSWLTTIHEMPTRAFSFTRPGPIAIDKNGDLWITQEAAAWPPIQHYVSQPSGAAIKLYDKNGNYLNKQITDLVNPTSLSYDRASDRLLISENGPDQNIRFYNVYTGTPTAPVCTSTFGIPGGVFAGKNPGLLHDPDAGGDARFFGPTGAGLDANGNLYVVSNQTNIFSFAPDGKLLWKLLSVEFCNTGDFDPARGQSDVWTATKHYTMDYHGHTAGGEWTLKSYLTNPFKYDFPPNLGASGTMYRKIKGQPIMYTCGQGNLGPIYMFRFEGEQIIPCGSFTDAGNGAMSIWTDANGDGIQQPGEVVVSSQDPASKVPTGAGTQSFDVDNNGNVYLAKAGVNAPHPHVDKYTVQGLNDHGAPIYSPTYTSIAAPPPFDVNWGNKARIRYQSEKDAMFMIGETRPFATQTDHDYGGTLACYDHWSTKPVKRFITVLPDPALRSDFVNGAPPYTQDGFIYQAFDEANGISFVSDLWDEIRVIDAHGNLIMNMIPGPEMSGLGAWEDEIIGVRAHYDASTGEYDILQENSGWRGRENFYRWNPTHSK